MSQLDIQILENISPDSELGKNWEKLVCANPYSGIMQSLFWAQAKKEQGLSALHLGIFENTNLIGGAILYKAQKQNGTNILISPEGPVLPWQDVECSRQLLGALVDFIPNIKAESPAMALRIEPRLEIPLPVYLLEFNRAPIDLIPRETLYIDLSLSEDQLLAQMKEKGRYNIRLSERNKVQIVENNGSNAIDRFYFVMQEASLRDNFALEPKTFFLHLANNLLPSSHARFLFAEHEGDTLGTLLLITYGKRATYLYGGISNNKRNLMGGYALQWQAMKAAKEFGCTIYDFYGYDRFRSPEHLYARFSQFKSQFGGKPITLIGAHEYFYLDNLADIFVQAIQQIENKGSHNKELIKFKYANNTIYN
jgi:lipid II:glycine glycyltransferase (peptidoglycan interpeptide bridge formation enzyme)